MDLKVGDIFYINTDGKYYVYKLLKLDKLTNIHHVIVYKPFDVIPSNLNLNKLEIFAKHIPIDTPKNYTLIDNQPVLEQELDGFFEYLKLTDFARYIEQTGRKVEDVVNKANQYYLEGDEAYRQEDFRLAIEKYTRCVEEFPLFYEAIQRRAFTKMALGEYLDAIKDFEFALEINSDLVDAEFAIGECYFKLADFNKAIEQFEHTLKLYPDDELTAEWLEMSRRELAQQNS